MKSTKTFELGDRVKYSSKFLRNTGIYTGEIPFLRGAIVDIFSSPSPRVVVVCWDTYPTKTSHILECNLVHEKDPEYFQ